ncbi:MAG: outer membrane beta-barrel protein [Alphaproteobacteria bacterium]
MVKYLLFLTAFVSVYGSNVAHSFYGGANLGLNVMTGKRNDTATKNRPPLAQAVFSENKGIYKRGASGGIFAGYLLQYNNFGIGPELFWNYTNIDETLEGVQTTLPGPITTDFNIKNRITNQYGINVRMGCFFNTCFVYALCGLHWQQYNFHVKAKQDNGFGIVTYPYNTSNKITQGNSIGLGVQKQLTPNYDIGFEYKLTNLPRKNYEFNVGDAIRTKLNSSVSYKLHSFSLRFICKI